MAGPEHRPGLADHPAVKIDHLRRRARAPRSPPRRGGRTPAALSPDLRVMVRRCSPAIRGESASVSSETGENVISPSFASVRLQGRGEPPFRRQLQPEADLRLAGGRPLGVEQAGGPVDDAQRGVAIAQVPAGRDGRGVADGVEPGHDLADARPGPRTSPGRARPGRAARGSPCRRESPAAARRSCPGGRWGRACRESTWDTRGRVCPARKEFGRWCGAAAAASRGHRPRSGGPSRPPPRPAMPRW